MDKTNKCDICGKAGRRLCPGINGVICSTCCGTRRNSEIACASDCPHSPFSTTGYDLWLKIDNLLPEFTALRGAKQNRLFHQGITADEHTLLVLAEMDELIAKEGFTGERARDLRLLALLHDIGKVSREPGHEARSEEIFRGFLRRTGLAAAEFERHALIIGAHKRLGRIAASRLRRILRNDWASLTSASFKRAQQVDIRQLAGILLKGADREQALKDLHDLYLLTIADIRAVPLPGSDTGNRYSSLVARCLAETYDSMVEAINTIGQTDFSIATPTSTIDQSVFISARINAVA